MPQIRVVHLVDDTTAGGVMRVLDHLLNTPSLSHDAAQSVHVVDRSAIFAKSLNADLIVSHLAINWRLLPSLLGLRSLNPRAQFIHVEHSYTKGFVTANVTNTRRFALLLRSAYRLFDRVIAVSHAQGQWLRDSGAVPASALTVIQSCVDLSEFRRLPRPGTSFRVFGAIGRLDKQKGFDTLIQAFRMTTRADIRLHIHGAGAEDPALRALAGDDPRIHFKGFADDPVAAMEAVDVVVMPSVWEAYGLVAIEALAAGRRLLVNPVDGLLDHLPYGAVPVVDSSVLSWKRAILQTCNSRTMMTSHNAIGPIAEFEESFSAGWKKLMQERSVGPKRSGSGPIEFQSQ